MIKTVENRTRFVAEKNHFRNAVSKWEKAHRNEKLSFAEEEKLKRGVAMDVLSNSDGRVPISGKLTQVEKVFSGEYEENGTGYWSQVKEGRYNEKKNENGQTIEFELGATKYTKFFSYGTQESLDNVINTDSKEAKRLKDNGEFSLEAALQNAKTFFRCEIPVRMEKGHDYIVEAIVCFPAEKKKLNRTVNYEYELNKIIKEAMRTGNPVVDSTADRIFDDMVLYDVIKVVEKTDTSGTVNAPSDLIQNQSSENVGTFDRTNSDVRYELRENEQRKLTGNEITNMDWTKGGALLERILKGKPKEEKSILQKAFSDVYPKAVNAKSVDDLADVEGADAFSKPELQLIYNAAKEDAQNYLKNLEVKKVKDSEFYDGLYERIRELMRKPDYSQEIGEQGNLDMEKENQQKREITGV